MHVTTSRTCVANRPATTSNLGPSDFDCALKGFIPGQIGLLTKLVDREIHRLAVDALLGRTRHSRIAAWAYRQFLAPGNRVKRHDYTVLTAARLHEIADRNGANALHAAVETSSVEGVTLVIAAGNVRGGVQATNRQGCTPVQRAVQLALPLVVRQCAPPNPDAGYVQRTFAYTPARMLVLSDVPVSAVRAIIAAFIAGGVNPAHGCNVDPRWLTLIRQFHPNLTPLLDAPAA